MPILQMGKLRLAEVATSKLLNLNAQRGLFCSKFQALLQWVSILAAYQNHLKALKKY